MKVIFIIMACFMTFTCYSKNLKLAIISESGQPLADLVLSDISSQSNFEVMERTEINKILQEQQLTKISLSGKNLVKFSKISNIDIFVEIKYGLAENNPKPLSFSVFNAKNGFKVTDEILTSELLVNRKIIVNSILKLRILLEKKQPFTNVAILSIRNIGGTWWDKSLFNNIVIEVEKNLVASPEIAILERKSLNNIVKERKLTNDFQELWTSSYLLDFEFCKGKNIGDMDLLLYILSTSENILGTLKYKNCFKNRALTIKKITNDLGKFFKKKIPTKTKLSTEEAKRFAKKYQFYKKLYNEKKAKNAIISAIALDPKNPEYQYQYITNTSYTITNSKKYNEQFLTQLRQLYTLAKQFRRRYPDFPKEIRFSFGVFPIRKNFWTYESYKLKTFRKEMKVYQDIIEKLRTLAYDEKRKKYKFDLSNGINNEKELFQYTLWFRSINNYRYYFDYNKLLADRSQKIVDYINLLEKIKFHREYYNFFHNAIQLFYGYIDQHLAKNFHENYFKSDYIEKEIMAAKKSKFKFFNQYGAYLELVRKTTLKKFNPVEFEKDINEYFKIIKKLYDKNDKYLSRLSPRYNRHFDSFLALYPQIYEIFHKALKKEIIAVMPVQDNNKIA